MTIIITILISLLILLNAPLTFQFLVRQTQNLQVFFSSHTLQTLRWSNTYIAFHYFKMVLFPIEKALEVLMKLDDVIFTEELSKNGKTNSTLSVSHT